tara:strand:+ start:110 stop:301 length:192 start_codon:yes stop_codon:yes gene_type:complete
MSIKIITMILLTISLFGCGKVGPLSLPEDKIDRSLITYPCDEVCQKAFEEEKKRQQSVILKTE